MATDIATLVLAVDSRPAAMASADLDRMAVAADRAERSTHRVESAAEGMTQRTPRSPRLGALECHLR